MSEVERLVASIVHFLGEQLRNDALSADGKESLEVAIQCLETAYSISSSDAHLLPSRALLEIFSDAVKHEPVKSPEEASSSDKAEAERLKNEGNNLMKNEDFEEALKKYTEAIKLDSRNPVYYCNRAAAYSKLNNHTFALEDCQRSIEIDSEYSKAYGRMGLAYASLNDHKRAKELYEKAIELDPYNDSYRNNLRIAEEKIIEQQKENPFEKIFSGAGGLGFDQIMSNPAIMNLAQKFISDPNAQNFLGQMMTGMGGGAGPSASGSAPQVDDQNMLAQFMQAGKQMAEQIQQNNPDLLDQLRRDFHKMDPNNENNQ